MLIDVLGWKSFTQNDLAQSICLDCIYDSVLFCVNKGFAWPEVSCIIKLVCEMLHAVECEYMTAFLSNCHWSQHSFVWTISFIYVHAFWLLV